MDPSWLLSRRAFLKGSGACVALPWLDAMIPPNDPPGKNRDKPPVRLGFFYIPQGVVMANWKPAQTGTSFDLPSILKPLEPLRQHVTLISDLAADHCNGNGAGHEPSTGGFLTGVKCKHSEQAEAGGISVDQLAAQRFADHTPIDALTLGIDPGHAGDHGYSGTYLSHMSWRTPTTPSALEINPKELFDRLFRGKPLRIPTWGKPAKGARPAAKAAPKGDPVEASVLDLVREDAKSLLANLGANDRAKVEGYLDGIRGIERRLEQVEEEGTEQAAEAAAEPAARKAKGGNERPDLMVPKGSGIPSDYANHVSLMLDILTMAFWTDTTRVASFLFSFEKSNRAYPEIGAPGSHHSISHHGGKAENLDQLTRINTHHMSLFARMLGNMAKIKEGNGTLLDNVVLCYGSGISDSDRHNHDDLPMLIAGGGGGAIKGGKHIAFGKKVPVCNLWLDMLHWAGAPVERFGDSTGRLSMTDAKR